MLNKLILTYDLIQPYFFQNSLAFDNEESGMYIKFSLRESFLPDIYGGAAPIVLSVFNFGFYIYSQDSFFFSEDRPASSQYETFGERL